MLPIFFLKVVEVLCLGCISTRGLKYYQLSKAPFGSHKELGKGKGVGRNLASLVGKYEEK